jgi:hypothetical protein
MNAGIIGKAPRWELYLASAICLAAAVLLLESEVPPAARPAATTRPSFSAQESEYLRPLPVLRSPLQVATKEAGLSSTLSLSQTMVLIHSKLRQWSERKTGDRDTEDRIMNELTALLTDDNAGKIIKQLSPDELDGPFGTSALFRWMKTDPMTAANWVASRPEATDDQAWVIAHGLLEDGIDPRKYAVQLPESKWKQTYLLDAALDVLSTDPNEAISLAQQMAPGNAQTNLLQTGVNEWMGNDPGTTMNWIMSIGDPTLRDELISAGAKAYATSDPRHAATWAASTMGAGDTLDRTVLSIMDTWCAENPAEAAGWAAQLPEGETRTAAVKAVLGQWLQSNPPAAANWAQSLPGGDQILAGLSSN